MTGALVGYLTGATAVGKSELALGLAQRRGWSILSVDSRQIYRRLDLGTAKPTQEERARVPHLLIDELGPEESCSAGRYRDLALKALAAEAVRGRRVLAVGGAGLYWQTLTQGLHPLPRGNAEIRARHEEILRREGAEGLHRRLRQIDPETAARLSPRDRQRVSRALEVAEITGRPMSAALREPRESQPPSPPVIVLSRPRPELYRRIEDRCAAMLQAGLLREIEGLLRDGLSPDAPGLRTVGYREFLPHLLHGVPLASCVDRFLQASRQYAKRQETWIRHRLPQSVPISLDSTEPPEAASGRILQVLDGDAGRSPGGPGAAQAFGS